jgi:hypothetical protein
VRLAHHLHVPSQIIAGARLGIPTVVLIRDPEEAVLSLLLHEPYLTPRQALKDYVRFHRRILPYRGSFVVAKFDDVSVDFGAVIRRVNARFGKSFKEFEHTRENVERCFEIIEQYHLEKDGAVDETSIARPSAQREVMKNELRAAFHSARFERLRRDAYALYDTLTSS